MILIYEASANMYTSATSRSLQLSQRSNEAGVLKHCYKVWKDWLLEQNWIEKGSSMHKMTIIKCTLHLSIIIYLTVYIFWFFNVIVNFNIFAPKHTCKWQTLYQGLKGKTKTTPMLFKKRSEEHGTNCMTL